MDTDAKKAGRVAEHDLKFFAGEQVVVWAVLVLKHGIGSIIFKYHHEVIMDHVLTNLLQIDQQFFRPRII